MDDHITPKWANKLLQRFCGTELQEEFRGDLEEEFLTKLKQKGVFKAKIWYWSEVLVLIWNFHSRYKKERKTASAIMLNNYFKIAYRRLGRHKLYSGINIIGLAIGIACCMILLAFVSNELNFDRFHKNANRIYRVLVTSENSERSSTSAIITAAVAPSMRDDFPEVSAFTRFANPKSGFFVYDGKKINTSSMFYTDSSVFDVFSFKLLKGNPKKALTEPNSVVLTPELSMKIFGNNDPIGKTVIFNGKDQLMITGIIESAPSNSQLQYTCLISFSSLLDKGLYLDWNGGWNYYAYVLLQEQTNLETLKIKFPEFMDRNINDRLHDTGWIQYLDLEPLTDIHLFSTASGELSTKGSISTIFIFSATALIILVMACINFMNLTIVQASSRAKEIGIRKVSGANRNTLIGQFLLESFIYTLMAFLLSFVLILIFKPSLNAFLGNDLQLIYLSNINTIIIVTLILLLVTFGSGAYPAFYLSSFQPVKALKSQISKSAATSSIVNNLVVFQFSVSIVLIVCTWVIYNQLNFINNKELGFQKENILVVSLNSDNARKNYEIFKAEVAGLAGTISVGASSEVPGQGFTSNGYQPEGYETPITFHALNIDTDYLSTMDMAILEGRNFVKDSETDKEAILINESLANHLDWDEPIGKIIERNGKHEVIGVVNDFNYATLHQKIEPLLFTMKPWRGFSNVSIRISGDQIHNTVSRIESKWKEINTLEPFEFYFLDQSFNNFYKREQKLAWIFLVFSIIAIIIGCLGLFGLVSYTVKQRTKEIGIRKVLGANTSSLLLLLSRNYSIKVLLANLIAWPIAYYAMNQWLSGFYYHMDFSLGILFISGLITFIIALATVNLQTIGVASQNPTETLKYE